MMPEHWHVKTNKNPAKLEGWLVRYGSAYIVGEGDANLPANIVIPKCHNKGKATVLHGVFRKAGQWAELNRAMAHHWQYAGKEGAIVTEVANVHDGSGVRHLDKKINDYFLKK